MRGRDCIVVMAREPVAGSTKTRLAAAIGAREAASLYEAFLLDTLATCGNVPAELFISYAPERSGAERYFRRIAPTASLDVQEEVAFGARLSAAMQAAFDRGFERVAVIGSDIPHMAAAWFQDALASLDDHDLALGPTQDGGYYLLALRRPEPRLFEDIDWSSGHELGQTLSRAHELELQIKTVQATFDIDEMGDLLALREQIRTNGTAYCPRTAAVLEHLDVGAVSSLRAAVR